MLTKALLTGGVLSLLAGSVVYFGVEGADATTETRVERAVEVDERELAGASVEADMAIVDHPHGKTKTESENKAKSLRETLEKTRRKARTTVETVSDEKAEAERPQGKIEPAAKADADTKPKSRWLDTYLKRTKPEAKSKIQTSEVEDEPDKDMIIGSKSDWDARSETTSKRKVKIKTIVVDDEADLPEILEQELEDLDIDEDRVRIRMHTKSIDRFDSRVPSVGLPAKPVDYDMILSEARKLQVVDMRHQAFFEILDYAIDNGDFEQADGMVELFSTSAFRDTARGRIATGHARRGDADTALSVLDRLEEKELAAPIRLEIITALMATREERAAPPMYRLR